VAASRWEPPEGEVTTITGQASAIKHQVTKNPIARHERTAKCLQRYGNNRTSVALAIGFPSRAKRKNFCSRGNFPQVVRCTEVTDISACH